MHIIIVIYQKNYLKVVLNIILIDISNIVVTYLYHIKVFQKLYPTYHKLI
jgi:hypothetical protein